MHVLSIFCSLAVVVGRVVVYSLSSCIGPMNGSRVELKEMMEDVMDEDYKEG